MRRLLFLASASLLSACGQVDAPPPVVASTLSSGATGSVAPVAETQNCREFTAPIRVGNVERIAAPRPVGRAAGQHFV